MIDQMYFESRIEEKAFWACFGYEDDSVVYSPMCDGVQAETAQCQRND